MLSVQAHAEEGTGETPSDLGIFNNANDYFYCPPGMTLVRVLWGEDKGYICVELFIPYEWPYIRLEIAIKIYPPTPIQAFKAGICEKNLSNLPFRFGIIRHDDVESYRQDGLHRTDELSSGFYAIDESSAIRAADIYVRSGFTIVVYTPGEVRHERTSTFSCNLIPVSEEVYQRYRTYVKSKTWDEYHLIEQNCQHWAEYIQSLAEGS